MFIIEPLCHRMMYLLGYIPKDNRLYLGDKDLTVISYSLLVSVLEYQTAVMRRDFSMADRVLPAIPKEQRIRVAHFLEKQVRDPQVDRLSRCLQAADAGVAVSEHKNFMCGCYSGNSLCFLIVLNIQKLVDYNIVAFKVG